MDEILLSSSSPPPPPPTLSSTLHSCRRNLPLVIPPYLTSSEHDHFRPSACNSARVPPATAVSYDALSAAALGSYSSMERRRRTSFFEGDSDGNGGDNGISAPLASDGTSRVDVDGLGLRFARLHVGGGDGHGVGPLSRSGYGRAGVVTPSGALEEEEGSHGGQSYGSLFQNCAMLSNATSVSDCGRARKGYSYDYGQGQSSVFPHCVSNATSASAGGGARNGYSYGYVQGRSSNFPHNVSNATSASDGGGARNGYSYDYGKGRTSVFPHYVKQPADQDAFDRWPPNDAGVDYLNGLNANPLNSFAYSSQPRSVPMARNISNIQSQSAGIDVNWSTQPSSHSAHRFPNPEVAAPSQWQRELQSLGSKRNPRGFEDFVSDNDSLIFQGREINYGGRSRRGGHKRLMQQENLVREILPMHFDYPDNQEIQDPDWPYYSQPSNNCNIRMHNLATEQESCRSLQQILEEGTPEGVEKVYNGIIYHVAELIKHPFGNYLIQKLLEHCNEEQKLGIIRELTEYPSQLVQISKNPHGTRAVQKLIENLRTREQIALVASSLKPGVLDLIKDTHGNHVIKSCLTTLRDEDKKFIFDVLAKHCIDIATNCHGCCVLQMCITQFSGEYRSKLLDHICSNGLHLAVDDYGNYVIQFILEKNYPRATANLMRQFEGHYVELSKLKFSSHVVERCLALFKEEGRDTIIRELLSVSPFDQLLQDPFANYVIKKALQCSQGSSLHDALIEAIRPYEAYLRSSPFCKQIFYLLKN